ncbi:MAG: exodeoxyribonuclease V subunit gamma [Gallionellaceae bacterium]|nr:exodeoxyribonuclease V subunit gamma [Gallionellaceae bacterium]
MSATTAPYDAVARRLLAAHPAPDLRGVTVILPNYHAAQPLARALARAANLPALLLPQMVTLNDWAQSITLDAPVIADSKRGALLYQHLRKQPWFENADLWSMAQELLELFDQLTHALTELPRDAEAFAAAVEQAYQARQNETLQLEARLVFELWHAMQSGDELDSARAYQQRLARLAAQASAPLFVLRASDWNALEQRFLDEYAQRAPVTVFDLREMGTGQDTAPLFFAAASLEQEARAAAMQVRRWLAEGRREIAVVAQDRMSARRARALLERAEVLVADETGWTFSTLSVSTALDRWLTTLQSDFYHHDLLDLLKSPFIFADTPADQRKAAVYRLERLLREQGVVSGLIDFEKLAANDEILSGLLARLHRATSFFWLKQRPLAAWLEVLRDSFAELGMDVGLARDDAGAQLLQALDEWRRELEHDDGRYRFHEWRRWLAQRLDTHTYRDYGMNSSVCFTHLAATRWRNFDAVLLLGCDAGHFPSIADSGRWFNDATRATLGLPTRASSAARQYDDLRSLLAMNDRVLITWQKDRNGEPCLLSPWLQLLRDRIETRSGRDLTEGELPALLAAEDALRVELAATTPPAPMSPPQMLPERVSVNAYNALVACPYQFHARHILRLDELDEVREGVEKRDYGTLVHVILQRFHQRYPRMEEHPDDELEIALRQISEKAFADLVARNFEARAWLARWFDTLPAYLAWQRDNESKGWYYDGAEWDFSLQLDGALLRGRIDRLDRKDEECKVLDYKTLSATLLRGKLKQPGEDVQLACYAQATQASAADFVSIDGGKVESIPLPDTAELAQLNAERLERLMQRIRAGAALPANGIEQVCTYCKMRGLCRKGEWQDE